MDDVSVRVDDGAVLKDVGWRLWLIDRDRTHFERLRHFGGVLVVLFRRLEVFFTCWCCWECKAGE